MKNDLVETTKQKLLFGQADFRQRKITVFRKKMTGQILFVDESDIERSRYRLKRRIRQNSEIMQNDFQTFITFTYDDMHIYDANASKNISSFINALHYEAIRQEIFKKFKDLKYLWKVEWGSHERYKDKNGNWQQGTARIHVHMLTNIPYNEFKKDFIKGKTPWFTKLWGRGIVRIDPIRPYVDKKGRTYTKEQGVLYYLFKYFKKEYNKDKKKTKKWIGQSDHGVLRGIAARRWGSSTHYKTVPNVEYECLGSETVKSEDEEWDFLSLYFAHYVEQTHDFLKNEDSVTYQWWLGSHECLLVSANSQSEFVEKIHEFLDKMSLVEFRVFVKTCAEKYPVVPDIEANRDLEFFDAEFRAKKREKKKRISQQGVDCHRTVKAELLKPLELYVATLPHVNVLNVDQILNRSVHGSN